MSRFLIALLLILVGCKRSNPTPEPHGPPLYAPVDSTILERVPMRQGVVIQRAAPKPHADTTIKVDTAYWIDSAKVTNGWHYDKGRVITTSTLINSVKVVTDSSWTVLNSAILGTVGMWEVPPSIVGDSAYSVTLLHLLNWNDYATVHSRGGQAVMWLPRNASRVPVTGGGYAFSVDSACAWINRVDSVKAAQYAEGIQIGDDITSTTLWGPAASDLKYMGPKLDSVSGCAKRHLPTLSRYIRARPTQLTLTKAGTPYKWVNKPVAWAQFHSRFDVNSYRQTEDAAAAKYGLCMVYGLNVSKGGDGSSGVIEDPNDPNEYEMSGPEIIKYAKVLMPPGPRTYKSSLFMGWQYTAGGNSRLRNTFVQLQVMSKTYQPGTCQ